MTKAMAAALEEAVVRTDDEVQDAMRSPTRMAVTWATTRCGSAEPRVAPMLKRPRVAFHP